MSDIFRRAIHGLTHTQVDFVCNERSLTKEQLFSMTEEELDDVYEAMCEIEITETPDSGDLSDRCKLASDVVTVMGNALAEAMGWLDEEGDFGDLDDEEEGDGS